MPLTIGQRIENIREQRGFSQVQVADLFGTKSAAISQWESGKRIPKPENLMKLALCMSTSVSDFLNVSEEESKNIQKYEQELSELNAIIMACENNPELVDSIPKYKNKADTLTKQLHEIINIAVLRNKADMIVNEHGPVSSCTDTSQSEAETESAISPYAKQIIAICENLTDKAQAKILDFASTIALVPSFNRTEGP